MLLNPKFKRRKISPAQKKKAEQEIAEGKSMVKAAKKEGEAEIKTAEEVLENVKSSRDKKRIEAAESTFESAKVEAKARVKTIRDRFAFSSPSRKFYGKVEMEIFTPLKTWILKSGLPLTQNLHSTRFSMRGLHKSQRWSHC